MSTLMDYVELRGDLTMLQSPFNEVDYSAFALLSYIDFAPVVTMNSEAKTIREVYQQLKINDPQLDFKNQYLALLEAMAYTNRYGNILVKKYFSETSEELIQQFAAVTFILEDGRVIVSFRGTDHTLIGWKENFTMLYQETIASEEKVVEYMNEISYEYDLKSIMKDPFYGRNIIERFNKYRAVSKQLPITFVGHSKGGHLAIYAGTIFQKEVYNFDGPGMNILLDDYEKNKDQVHSFVPGYSLFGRFFEHKEKLQVVNSENSTYKEHAVFSWSVGIHGFKEGVVQEESLKALQNVFEFLDGLSKEEKKEFVEAMFKVFDELGVKTIDDVRRINYHRVFSGIDVLIRMDSKTRNNMIEMITILINEFK